MTSQIAIASGVEIFLMALSFVFLSSAAAAAFYRWAGTVFLCLTFCWSVILGCVLALNQMTFRI